MFLKYYNFLPYVDISWNLNLLGFCTVGTVKSGLYMYVTSSNIKFLFMDILKLIIFNFIISKLISSSNIFSDIYFLITASVSTH